MYAMFVRVLMGYYSGAMGPRVFWQGTVGIVFLASVIGILAFVAYLLFGPGITVVVPSFFVSGTSTPPATPTELSVIETVRVTPPAAMPSAFDTAAGVLFECKNDRALKAEFVERNVRLALSDGRMVLLPKIVSTEGEIRYANTDGSFVFKNTENIVFVEEDGVITYSNCAAS